MIVLSQEHPYSELSENIRSRIDDYSSWVIKNVPFYQFKKGSWSPNEGFSSFPFTYDYELAEQPLDFLPVSHRSVRICTSGGTLGCRKLIQRTIQDIDLSNQCTVKMFDCTGISSKDRVAILQPFDLWNIGHLALKAFEEIGASTCPMGFSATNDTVIWLLTELNCNVLYASPSRVMQLAEICMQKNIHILLDKILCAGEPILPHHRETASEVFEATMFGIYGSEETDGIGAECQFHAGYHLFNDKIIFEIVDPVKLKPCSENKGALAITLLEYTGTVLFRYILGDLVSVSRTVCECGKTEPRLSMQGRIRDTVWLFDGNKLPLSSIDKTLALTFGKSIDYQLVIDHKDGIDFLYFHFVTAKLPVSKDKLIEAIIQSSQEMEVAFRYTQSLKIRIEFHSDRNALYTTERGKTPRIIDTRQQFKLESKSDDKG